MDRRTGLLASLLLAVCLVSPVAVQGQGLGRFATPGGAQQQGWMPIRIGPRIGYELRNSSLVLGAGARIPVIPSGAIEVLPSFDVTFQTGLKEYEYNLEAVYAYGGRHGALYGGGGLAWRNTIFEGKTGRQTKQGYSIVIGLRSFPVTSHFETQFEFRWIFVDPVLRPRVFSLGINIPL